MNWIYNSYGEVQTQMREPIFILDNTKSFDNQSEEVYGKIVEFLENNLH